MWSSHMLNVSRRKQQIVEVASYLVKGGMLHIRQYIRETGNQDNIKRIFVRIGLIALLGMVFFGVLAYSQPSKAHAASGNASVAAMIDQVFGPYAPGALSVAECESGLNPNAYNPISIGGSNAVGIFQILYPGTWYTTSEAGMSPYDPMANIEAAHEIFVRDGYSWREWVCQP
jgi:hypothetical protein